MTKRSRIRLSSPESSVEPRVMLSGVPLDVCNQSLADQSMETATPNASASPTANLAADGSQLSQQSGAPPTEIGECGSEQVATEEAAPAQDLAADEYNANAEAAADSEVPADAQVANADPCAADGPVANAAIGANGAVPANAAIPAAAAANSVAALPSVPGGDICGPGAVAPMANMDAFQQQTAVQQSALAANAGGAGANGQVATAQQTGNQGNQSSQPTRAEVQAISRANQAGQGSPLATNSSSSRFFQSNQTSNDITPPDPSPGVGPRPFGQTASSTGANPSSLTSGQFAAASPIGASASGAAANQIASSDASLPPIPQAEAVAPVATASPVVPNTGLAGQLAANDLSPIASSVASNEINPVDIASASVAGGIVMRQATDESYEEVGYPLMPTPREDFGAAPPAVKNEGVLRDSIPYPQMTADLVAPVPAASATAPGMNAMPQPVENLNNDVASLDSALYPSMATGPVVPASEVTATEHAVDPVPQAMEEMINDAGADSDVIVKWNQAFREILVANESDQNPGFASRAMAMMNLAMYDATVASGGSGNTFYDHTLTMPTEGASAQAAAAEAAYTTLSSLYPEQQGVIDSHRDAILGGLNGDANAESLSLGQSIGNGIVDSRADDGSKEKVDYQYKDGIGTFQSDPLNPDVPVWGPGWGKMTPFAISSAADFTPPSTPELTSQQYADSYNEVLSLGSLDSETRTADQTEAGIFWAYDRAGLGTPLSLYNKVIETVALDQGNTFEQNAALYTQTSVSMADAAIVAWDTKFGEEFWRPVTAIHDGDIDGNTQTTGDADWTALGAPDGEGDITGFTPQFPTYISGHATFGGALFGSLQEFYDTDDIPFELSSDELDVLTENPKLQSEYGLNLDDSVRSFDTLSEAMAENGRSRVYLGIHFDFDDTVGQEVGQEVASSVASKFADLSNDGKPNEAPPS